MNKPDSCKECTLYDQPGPVWGVGPSDARLVYIAQNPGQHEVQAHPMEPLIGPSGNIFNYQLSQVGIRRNEIYITNQVKCLTPLNREPTPHEVRCCKPLLDRELARLPKADTFVLSGAVSFKASIGTYSSISPVYKPTDAIFSRMGCVEIKDSKKYIGTIHPAFVMRMPDWKQAANDHLAKAWTIAGVELPKININQHPTDLEVIKAVDHCMLVSREFVHDVETVGLEEVEEDDYIGSDFQLTMCGFGSRPYEALVLEPEQIHLLALVFESPEIWRYEHNGPYDTYHEERILGKDIYRSKPFDTMLGTHYLRSHAPKKLKPFVLSQYTNLPYYDRKLGQVNMRLYNGMDVVTTFLAAKEQRRQMQKWQIEELFYEFGMPSLPIAEEMRRVGVRCDLKKAILFKRITLKKIEKCQELIAKAVGPSFNPSSPKQVMEMLYVRLKLPPQFNEKRIGNQVTKKLTSDFEARKRLRRWIDATPERRGQYKVAGILLSLLDFVHGEEKKLEYIDRISGDGRIHAYYKTHGAKSFRFSSSPNLQNFPVYDISAWGGARRDDNETAENPIDAEEEKEEAIEAARRQEHKEPQLGSLRSIVIPDKDEDLILTCDYAQLQLTIYAVQFNVKWLLNVLESGEYLYGVIYEKLYGEPFFEEGKPKTKEYKLKNILEQRIRNTKAVPLGFLFGRSAEAVAKEYGWTLAEAEKLRTWWYNLNPELPRSYQEIKYKLAQKGWIRHCFGQIMHHPNGKLTEAINGYAQSPEAFIMMGTMIGIDRELKRRGYNTRIMLTVHDSISINVSGARVNPDNMVTVAEEVVFPVMGRPIPQLKNFRFKFSAEVSRMWDWETKKYSEWKSEALSATVSRGDVFQSTQSSGRS